MAKKRFKMTETQHARMKEACKPVPYMVVGGIEPRSPQENANTAWRALADDLGFAWDTVEAIPDRPSSEFMAEAVATDG